jgi:hypothetical protein
MGRLRKRYGRATGAATHGKIDPPRRVQILHVEGSPGRYWKVGQYGYAVSWDTRGGSMCIDRYEPGGSSQANSCTSSRNQKTCVAARCGSRRLHCDLRAEETEHEATSTWKTVRASGQRARRRACVGCTGSTLRQKCTRRSSQPRIFRACSTRRRVRSSLSNWKRDTRAGLKADTMSDYRSWMLGDGIVPDNGEAYFWRKGSEKTDYASTMSEGINPRDNVEVYGGRKGSYRTDFDSGMMNGIDLPDNVSSYEGLVGFSGYPSGYADEE